METESNQKHQKPDKLLGTRHIQMLLLFLLLSIGYGMRVNLSVSINAMTDPSASANPDVPVYNWKNKSIILSSFFWGYIVLQVIAGQLAKTKYGPKWFLVLVMFVNSLGSVMIPFMAEKFGSEGVISCRIIQGLFQGFMYPTVHALLGKWAPPPERSRFGTFVYSGTPFGTIVSMPLTGYICASWLGWPWSFHIFGIIGVLWIILWILLGANSPSEHKTISEEERNYIIHSFGLSYKSTCSTPWKSIFTSMPFWAIIVASFGRNWGYTTLLTEIPSYLDGVMHFNMKDNGTLSAAPFLALMLLSFVFGPISDALINNKVFSRGTVRKIFNTIGIVGPAVALLILSYLPDDQTVLSVTMLIIAVGTNAAEFCGFLVNHVDLSPNHAGILMGIANGSSNVFSILAPLAVQYIVGNDTGNRAKWRTVFIISSIIFILSDIFYVIYASGEVQPWDYLSQEDIDATKTKQVVVVVEEENREKCKNKDSENVKKCNDLELNQMNQDANK